MAIVEKVPPSTIHSLPSLQHMHLIAESIEDLKTQQQILHALLDDLRRSSRCCCGSGGRCSKTTRAIYWDFASKYYQVSRTAEVKGYKGQCEKLFGYTRHRYYAD
uniref:Uncharacterized protein n=1 Tax=Hyaloperonospora arabidopsidis (strain Emoy2) TaxID=559515 RepID=M4BBM8_HYAAE